MATNVCMALETAEATLIAEDYPATATDCREARATLEESTVLLRAVAVELRCRKINHNRSTSPTLVAWAARIDAALDHLEGR
jgi:hypothetical protein